LKFWRSFGQICKSLQIIWCRCSFMRANFLLLISSPTVSWWQWTMCPWLLPCFRWMTFSSFHSVWPWNACISNQHGVDFIKHFVPWFKWHYCFIIFQNVNP
jgi:hypothetical protein